VVSGSDVIVASDGDAVAWDDFASRCRQATGYHEWAWRRVFQRAFDHEPIYLIARHHGRVEGILPLVLINSLIFGRTLTSLPFLNYGGVAASNDTVAQDLLARASEVARLRRCVHLELRHVDRRFAQLPHRQHKVTMLLDLEVGMWDRLDRKLRNQIRKSQKSGLTTEQGGTALVSDFYSVFARNMRDLGTPVYARRLFVEVLDAFPARARLHVVRLHAVPIAAALTYRTATTVEVPWASSVRDYNTFCPNHLLYWSVIEAALENGCKVLDFGRSTPEEGTFKFKQQWGARPRPLHWEYVLPPGMALPNASPSNPKFHLAIRLWKKLPLAVATRVGPQIVRSIP
jgi:FemAB-related protein (PEP-CTERM system-associated)